MSIFATRGAPVSATALVLCVGVAGPATAAQNADTPSTASNPIAVDDSQIHTAPPEEPEEDLIEMPDEGSNTPEEPTSPVPPPKGDSPNGEYCGPDQGVYIPSSQGKQYHKGVGPTLSNTNRTSRTAKSTFISEVSGEVGLSVTAGLAVSKEFMVAKIEGKFDVNLSFKLTAKLGNNIAVDTPPKKTTNAKYGVYRLKHTGKSYKIYSNCTTSAKKTITSYSPYRVGWYLWES